MKRDSLSTPDLRERPENKITIIRRVLHHQIDGPLELPPGERAFAAGPRHQIRKLWRMAQRPDRLPF
jgi:hypothetical protein